MYVKIVCEGIVSFILKNFQNIKIHKRAAEIILKHYLLNQVVFTQGPLNKTFGHVFDMCQLLRHGN